MANLTDLTNQLSTIRKQILFTTALALTIATRKIENVQKVALQCNLESLLLFTIKSIKSRGARKNNLKAKVFVMNIAIGYLMPFEIRGVHKLNGASLLKPKNIKLNKHGKLSRNKLNSLKAKNNIFIGELKDVYGIFQRKKARKGRKNKKRLKRLLSGTCRDR